MKTTGFRSLIFGFILIVPSHLLAWQPDTVKVCRAFYAAGARIHIDGLDDEPAWQQVSECGDFIQQKPYQQKLPTCQTGFRVLYDDEYVYFFIRAYDQEPQRIVRRLARRDDLSGDWVGFMLDSYNDGLTSFFFAVNAAGVKMDGIQSDNSGDGDPDFTWDAIWDAKIKLDAQGWAAEIRIPLSQLRFDEKSNDRGWGLNVFRNLHRLDEFSMWQFIARDAPGWVRFFGRLQGLDHLKAVPQVEIMPYMAVKSESYQKEQGNPFRTGHDKDINSGVDGKISLSSNLILDYTVNPDFGQVEADPSEVNLTAFETYFEEKRPFFIEGRNILDYKITPGDGDMSGDNLFYSRRIGRRPRYYPEGEYVKMPEATPILAALKLTGKSAKGWSVGVLESMTGRAYARVSDGNSEAKELSEPFANYFVARVQKDLRQGATQLGGIVTNTVRDLSAGNPALLPKTATTGAFDFSHAWHNRTWYINIKGLFSHVTGSREAINDLQKTSVHNFQRPDASHLTLDSTLTHLGGHGGLINFGRGGNSHWSFTTFVSWRSPGLELNDVGYQRLADDITQVVWVGYRYWEPVFIFRSFGVNMNQWSGWDFGGNNKFKGGNLNGWAEFKNFWSLGLGFNVNGTGCDNHMLRGGPSVKVPGGYGLWMRAQTDSRENWNISVSSNFFKSGLGHGDYRQVRMGFRYQPVPAMSFGIFPWYAVSRDNLQYISTLQMGAENRYILGHIRQQTAAMEFRVNLNLTPDMTLQYYGQLFISAGKYSRFKRITQPQADRYEERFAEYESSQLSLVDDEYRVDEDRDGRVDYTFGQPDFKALYFLSNLVFRWEFVPGSTLYLVWSQNRSDYLPEGRFTFGDDVESLFDVYPTNIFMLKVSYRVQYQHLKRIF